MKPAIRIAVVAVVGSLLLTAVPASAQPPPLDHFKVYLFDPAFPIFSGLVTVRDQFGEREAPAEGPFFFGLPTSKNNEGVFNPRTHLTGYFHQTPEPVRRVVYENQFGENVLETQEGVLLLVPALKNSQTGEEFPRDVSHFKCYEAFGQPVGLTVTLETQFGFENVIVEHPELFCNPAEKELPSGEVFPIVNPDDHLVCYRIVPSEPLGVSLTVLDQFVNGPGGLGPNEWLCVPSKKTGVTPTEESTWGRMKSIYR